ncbi:RNA-binding protein [Viridibacillus arvi]|uniref:RNA-binding protein n=1 Tax=Viridibacillus arvi TaxID=263475 RepID=UPI0034CEA227
MVQVLEQLAAARRNGELVQAMVRSVGERKVPVYEPSAGKTIFKDVECAVFELGEGVKGICPVFEFSEHEFNSLVGFVGTVHELLILELDVENKIAVVSVKKADQQKCKQFWNKLKELQETGEEALQSVEFEGVITGYNLQSQTIFVKVQGQDCFLKKNDFDHNSIRNILDVAERNQKIQVKVVRFNEETNQVQVSRKLAIPDPFEELRQYGEDDAVVGTVSGVHPEHGIFVQLSKGVQIKASKPKDLEPPIVGDIVTVRIKQVDFEKRHARSVIINYPQGKKKLKDVTSFLYE